LLKAEAEFLEEVASLTFFFVPDQCDQMSLWKSARNVAQSMFRRNEHVKYYRVKKQPKHLGYFCN
jgi:hypothetical protein